METPDPIAHLGMRAYELGRLRNAALVALYVLPISFICAWQSAAFRTCACLTVVLLGGCVFLRWKSQWGQRVVGVGLLAGSIPMLVGLGQARWLSAASVASPLSAWTLTAVLAGLLAGIWLGIRMNPIEQGFSKWALATVIAGTVASLGCIRLSWTILLGVGVGLCVGTCLISLAIQTMAPRE